MPPRLSLCTGCGPIVHVQDTRPLSKPNRHTSSTPSRKLGKKDALIQTLKTDWKHFQLASPERSLSTHFSRVTIQHTPLHKTSASTRTPFKIVPVRWRSARLSHTQEQKPWLGRFSLNPPAIRREIGEGSHIKPKFKSWRCWWELWLRTTVETRAGLEVHPHTYTFRVESETHDVRTETNYRNCSSKNTSRTRCTVFSKNTFEEQWYGPKKNKKLRNTRLL